MKVKAGAIAAAAALSVASAKKESDPFSFTVEEKPKEIRIGAQDKESGADEDKLEFDLYAKSEYFLSEFYFRSKDLTGAVKKDVREEIRLRLREIVEFEDSGTPGFDKDDVIRSTYPAQGSNWDWGDFVAGSENTEETKDWTLTTTDGVVGIKSYYSGVTKDDFTPEALKMDFLINNYPYTPGAKTKLAFRVEIKTKDKMKESTELEGGQVQTEVSSSVKQGYVAWVPEVTADGTTVSILASKGEADAKGPEVYYTIDDDSQPASIVWDPTIGRLEQGFSLWEIVGMAVGGLCFVLFLAFLGIKVRNNKKSNEEESGKVAAAY